MTEALLGFAAVFVLALLRIPLAFAMGLVGFVGLGLLRGWAPTMANAAQVVYDTGFAYTLSVVPLFILMVVRTPDLGWMPPANLSGCPARQRLWSVSIPG
jgi:hypothetical protein